MNFLVSLLYKNKQRKMWSGTCWGTENSEAEDFQKCCTASLFVLCFVASKCSKCRGGNRASHMLLSDSISGEERECVVCLLPPLSKGWHSLFISLPLQKPPLYAMQFSNQDVLYLYTQSACFSSIINQRQVRKTIK